MFNPTDSETKSDYYLQLFEPARNVFEANLKMIGNPRKYDELKPTFDKGMELFHKYFNYLWD